MLDGDDKPSVNAPEVPGKEYIYQWIDNIGEGDCAYPSGEGLVSLDPVTYVRYNGTKRIFSGLDKDAALLKVTCPRDENVRKKLRDEYGKTWGELAYIYTAYYAVEPCSVTINYRDWNGNSQTCTTLKKNGQPLSYDYACPAGCELDYFKNDNTGENCGKSLSDIDIKDDTSFTAVYKNTAYNVEVNYWDEASQSWKKEQITTDEGTISAADLSRFESKAVTGATGVSTTVNRWEYYYTEGGMRYNYTPGTKIYADAKIKMVISREVAITYNLNGGTSSTLNDETAYSLLDYRVNVGYAGRPDTADANYTFAGWLDESTGTLYAKGETARFTKPTTLKAQWMDEDSVYTVTLDGGRWLLKDGNPEKTYYVSSSEVDAFVEQLKQEYRSYKPDDYVTDTTIYSFTGELIEVRTYRSVGLTLKSESRPVEYKVTWIYDNGNADYVDTVNYGLTYTSLPSCTRAEDASAVYTFSGWDTDSDGIKDRNAGDSFKVTGDVTIRAIWNAEYKSYSVRYAVDGDYVGTVTYCKVNDTVSVADKYVMEGYEVSGWTSTDVTVSGGKFVMPAKDVTFTATATPKAYKATYVVNGSTWKEETFSCGSTVTAPVPEAPDGMMFTGWTSEDVTVNVRTFTMPARNVVLNAGFAVRPAEKITVIYYVDGSAYERDVVSPGELVTVPSEIDPARVIGDTEGKVFSGWGSDYFDLSEGGFTPGRNDGPYIKIYGTYSDADAQNTVRLYIPSGDGERLFWTLYLDNGEQYELPVYGTVTGWTGDGVENNVLTVPAGAEKLNITAETRGKIHSITFSTEEGGINFGPENAYDYLEPFTDYVQVGEKYYLPETVNAVSLFSASDWVTLSKVEIMSDAGGKYIIMPDEDVSFSCWRNINQDDYFVTKLQLLLPSGEIIEYGSTYDCYGIQLPQPVLNGYTFESWYENGEKIGNSLYVNCNRELIGKFVPSETKTGSFYLDGEQVFRGVYELYGTEMEYLRFISPDFGMPEFNVFVKWAAKVSLEIECEECDQLDEFISGWGISLLDTEYMGINDIPYDDFNVSFTTADTGGNIWVKSEYPYRISQQFNAGDTVYLPAPGDAGYDAAYSVGWYVSENGEEYVKIPDGEITVTRCAGGCKFTVPESPQENAEIRITCEVSAK